MASFTDSMCDPAVRGFIHTPRAADGNAIILTHGAGGNCNAPLLVALAEIFSLKGITVLRCDLSFRQEGRSGPPFPAQAARDRDGLRNAVAAMKKLVPGRVYLGGHSYGGRQSTMLCAEEPELVCGLLLLSYPLHPPRKPEQLRTQHLPNLRTPSLFVHGTRDPFGSIEEMEQALRAVPAPVELLAIEGAGHDLGFSAKKANNDLPQRVFSAWSAMAARTS